jgi:hypothetical protein
VVVEVVLTRIVATVVVAAAAGLAWAAGEVRRGLVVVGDGGRVVVVDDDVVVVGSTDVVVSSRSVVGVDGSVPLAPALSDRRMAGSLPRWGTPAMATPTAAHTTSMSTVTERCPGLTAGTSFR